RPLHPLHLRILRLDHVVLIWRMRAVAVSQAEVSGRQMQGIAREYVSGPRTSAARQNDGIDSILFVNRNLRLNDSRAEGRAVGIVPAGHVHFDVAEALLSQMRLERCESLARLHVGHQPQIEFGDGPMRKNGLAAGSGVAADQAFDVYRWPRLK